LVEYPIFDGHNDTLTKMYFNKCSLESFVIGNEKLHIDLPKAAKGNFIGGIYAIFVPPLDGTWDSENIIMTENGYNLDIAPPIDNKYAEELTEIILCNLNSLTKLSDKKLYIVRKHSDLAECIKQRKMAVVVHLEGAEAVREDLSNLENYYNRGLRSIGLVWSRKNNFASGVPFCYPSTSDIGEGLTIAGKKLVKKCNELGIIVDLAHINEKGFFDTAALTNRPLVVSHSGANKLCNLSRNLTDDQIKTVKDSNGVLGVYFAGEMLNNTGELRKPQKMDLIVQHIDYIAEKFGIEYVVLGSDFDGCTLPSDLKDCSEVQKIFIELQKRGYKSSDLEKIAFKNWFRVIKDTFLG
jgi:membrane dipeptidase